MGDCHSSIALDAFKAGFETHEAEPIPRPADDLRIRGTWPIYPWVRDAHDLSVGGERQSVFSGKPLSATDVVENACRTYEAAGDPVNFR